MSRTIHTTASVLKAVLCFIDAEKTPKIAYDKDEYAKPLADKIKAAIGDRDGSQPVFISFNDAEKELMLQFYGVMDNIGNIFKTFTWMKD